MAANPKSLDRTSMVPPGKVLELYHVYHAEAYVLTGMLEHPLQQQLENYGQIKLEHTRRESHDTLAVGPTNIEGLISFKSGYTRVVGTHIKQKTDIFGNDRAGWVTLSSAAVEGYNIVDTLAVDRAVAQITTEHPMTQGHVPKVSFVGTRFENLQIGGYTVPVELDLNFCGDKPENDRPYLEDSDFLDRVEAQFEGIVDGKDAPKSVKEHYRKEVEYIDNLRKCAKDGTSRRNGNSKLQCSLIKKIGEIPIKGAKKFGNVIFIPNFGTVALAGIEVGVRGVQDEFQRGRGNGRSQETPTSHYFTLNMFDLKLGCPVGGSTKGPGSSSNGTTKP